MKQSLLVFMLLLSAFSFGQIKFEKGYLIDNKNTKQEVLIKNMDWKNNPDSFDYKTSEADKAQTATIKNVKEFGIYRGTRFLRAEVKIDRSSISLNNLTTDKNPDLREETLFLKELVKGDISLFKYAEPNQNRYFIQNNTGAIEQLIYKPYLLGAGDMVYNKEFKNQLKQDLLCSAITEKEIENTEYKEKDLTAIFAKYNQCKNPENITVAKQETKGEFNLNIRPRMNFNSLEFSNSYEGLNFNMGSKTTFGIGLEFEYILPFNKRKWGIIIEPNYQYYQSEITNNWSQVSGGQLLISAKYSVIEIPIGFRHYMYINNESKLFLNAQYVTGIVLSSEIAMKRSDNSVLNSLDSKVQPSIAFGLGYNYKNKFAAEARMTTPHGITAEYVFWSSSYKNLSLILSYTLF
ncbi:outer membrane beta-barrel protein [Chryseobacterium koreense]|uniref:Outer membrane protein beta-barrel domain-containing protein n=1 Tax=Chryseobacterium koreense CCUG 49689 TaxID=1304281 RepID=A0A0J7LPW2_9FLAO|nr:outer membrane beta-barrel protein [Chryseobacterium koreense]KMQ71085.1 hypothetical protein ACM44_09095 [Chryseobacterium koreense CCUG 49689]MBB5332818.1 hypothetical protein [Chryseobacterium koreense]